MSCERSDWTRRLEAVQQAFLNGEISYSDAVEKLYSSRLYYSVKGATEKVDCWAKMERPATAFTGRKLPVINQPLT